METRQQNTQKGSPIDLRRFISFGIGIALLIFMSGCAPKHRYQPTVKYKHPSRWALQKTLRHTYGDRYRYAGQGPNRFDCSGLVYYSFMTMNLRLPRRAIGQSKRGKAIKLNQLKYGDLIFFDTRKRFRKRVNHVGIYIGKGRFIHASSSRGRVVVSSLYKPFYRKRVIVCRRVMR